MTTVQTAPEDAAAANPRAHWPAELQQELEDNRFNPIVGSVLVSETDKVRVWHLMIPAGKRCTFHRHVLDYFWTCHTPRQGARLLRGRQHHRDGAFPRRHAAPHLRPRRVHAAQRREHRRHRPALHHRGVPAERQPALCRCRTGCGSRRRRRFARSRCYCTPASSTPPRPRSVIRSSTLARIS